MRRIATLLSVASCVLSLSSTAFAQVPWGNATLIDQEPTGGQSFTRCIDQTLGSYRSSMFVHGSMCPLSVKVNPETDEVQKE